MQYDYLIVGAGFFGAVFAHEAQKQGKRCLVVERRGHIGGNCYTADVESIHVHRYGAHIFHTSDQQVWTYINQFCTFNNYVNSPIANSRKLPLSEPNPSSTNMVSSRTAEAALA